MQKVKKLTAQDRIDVGFLSGLEGVERLLPAANGTPVQKGTVVEPERKITRFQAESVKEKKLKVAAYCRVSTLMECQEGSVYAQRRHYEKRISEEEDWEMAGIYFEQGASGTKAETRHELKRLLEDCKAGKVDLVLTKSISRFSRNITDCLEMVRSLNKLGVNILFEKENIHTGTMESELLLTILSTFAESESHSISDNVAWGIKKRFVAGTYKQAKIPYGYKRVDGEIAIDQNAASVVREIFSKILTGIGLGRIADDLNERGIESLEGKKWSQGTIRNMIQNPFYIGDTLYQKTFVDQGFIQKTNKGERDQYHCSSWRYPRC